MKKLVKEYLNFSKKERIGIIALLLSIGFFFLIPKWYNPVIPAGQPDTALLKLFARPIQYPVPSPADPAAEKKESFAADRPLREFPFDPNSITTGEWADLGIRERTINTIMNYRAKGGQFRQAADLRKIWGMTAADAERLIPFVRIKGNPSTQKGWESGRYKNEYGSSSFKRPELQRPAIAKVDINSATAAEWEALPGIGPVLANRILKYREKLGGFLLVEQVRKTYGISDSLFNAILPYLYIKETIGEQKELQKAVLPGINTATVAAMMNAGITEDIAKAIVVYRKQYGPFKELKELKNIVFINERVFQELSQKLSIQ